MEERRRSFRKLLPDQPDICPAAEAQLSFDCLVQWGTESKLSCKISVFLEGGIFRVTVRLAILTVSEGDSDDGPQLEQDRAPSHVYRIQHHSSQRDFRDHLSTPCILQVRTPGPREGGELPNGQQVRAMLDQTLGLQLQCVM